MTTVPQIHYACGPDGGFVAYQVVGEGPPDIVFIRTSTNHLEIQWEQPALVAFFMGLASIGRLIMFDARGAGMSDPFTDGVVPTLEDSADDALVVMDAAGCERAVLVGAAGGCTRSITLAAAHPERFDALVLIDGSARVTRAHDYPIGWSSEEYDARMGRITRDWGNPVENPSMTDAQRDWMGRYMRISISPGVFARLNAVTKEQDIRTVLPSVAVPTIVMHHAGADIPRDAHAVVGGQRPDAGSASAYLADNIPNARLVELHGRNIAGFWFNDPGAVVAEIERFVTGTSRRVEVDRLLATVLYTDIVSSTERAADVGDARWRHTLDALDGAVTDHVERFRGRVIKSLGDGHLATFDAPGRAIRCARAVMESASRLDLELRAGLHTGEVELRGDDVGGIALSIGRRVCDLGRAGDVLVSASIPPLVAGSGIEFASRGTHDLKGVPGRWELYEVVSA